MVLKLGHFGKYIRNITWWRWRMYTISWIDRVRNEEVLHRVKEDRNILNTVNRRKTKWTGHILPSKTRKWTKGRGKDISERKTRKKTKAATGDLKETRRYWKLQNEALDRSLQKSLWQRLWNCRKADNRMNGNVHTDQIPIHSTVHRIVVKA
jgi:hypothetical protein